MPYNTYLFCEKCGPPARLDLDYIETVNSYVAEGRKPASLDDRKLLDDYIIYSCQFCKSRYKYAFQDVEHRVRQYFSYVAGRYLQSISEPELSAAQADQQARTRKRLREMYEK